MRHLFGRIYEPSIAALGVELWTASLVAIRASRLVALDGGVSETILATYGQRLLASLARLNQASVFSRMSQPILPWGSRMFDESSREWVIALRLDCSRRRKLAQAINGNGFSSWPSARAEDVECCENHRGATDSLTGAVRQWTMPQAADFKTGSEYSENMSGNTRKDEPLLAGQAKLWSTPKAPTGWPESRKSRESRGSGGEDLAANALSWPTPLASDCNRPIVPPITIQRWLPLREAVLLYSLPAPERPKHGEKSSASPRRLNPRFVEFLMGWAPGWTHTGCALPATELCRYRQRMRSSLWRLLCSVGVEPALGQRVG